MTPTKQEMLLWTGALSLALTAVWGAAVLDGQIVMTQTGSPAAFGGPADTPMERGTGIVFGKAIEFGTTRPVAGALVTLGLPGAAPLRAIADAQGQFVFRDLPKGRFTLSAAKFGYIDGAYGRMRPSGPTQPIDLSDGQHVADALVPLWKYAVITGRVLDENGEPLVNSTVRTLRRTTAAGRRQLVTSGSSTTDDRGIYRIGSLEPGEYVVVVPMTQGSPFESLIQAFGLPRDLPAPPPTGGATAGVMMFATVDVQGTGGPMGGTTRLVVSGPDAGAPPAGMSADGHALTYQTEFYSSSLTAGRATAITVTSGEERGGVDFQLKPVRAVNIRGTVTAPDGQAGGVSLSLVPAEADDLITPIETASAGTDGNGEFRFTNIPPGQYTLRATKMPRSATPAGATTTVVQGGGDTMQMRVVTRSVAGGAPSAPLPTEPTLWTETSVSVGQNDLTDLAVPLRTGLRVSGRVDFTGSIDRPASDQLPAIPLSLEPADGRPSSPLGTARGRIESTGQFTTIGVAAGKYVLRVGAPRGWTLEGASYNGQDITDAPIDLKDSDATGVVITFVDRQTDLSGVVTSAAGTPDGAADVIVFTTDRSLWTGGPSPRRLKNVRTGSNGAYSIGNLPPGDYYVAAVSDTVAADWQNVEFLDGLTRSAVHITIGAGEKKTQALTTVRTR